MKMPLRILHVEDSANDAELVKAILEQQGIACDLLRVETLADYESALERSRFDIIFGDYTMPGFDGLSALRIAQEKCPDVPFIFVSGTIGEEVATEALKHGATDYVLKDRLSRLVPCVRRALKEVEEQRAHRQAQEALRESEARKKAMLDGALDCIIAIDHTGKIIEFNPAAERTFGYTLDEVIGKPLADLIIPSHLRDRHTQGLRRYLATREGPFIGTAVEVTAVRADGTDFPVELSVTPIGQKWPPLFLGHIRDITARKRAEQETALLQSLSRAVSEAEDFHSALSVTLREICDATGWTCGEAWMPGPKGKTLNAAPVWYSKAPGLERFRQLSKEFTFAPGVGIPGRAWSSKQPVWVPDVTQDQNFPRASIASEARLKTALGIPIRANDEVVAVMNFFAFEPREEDERLAGAVSTITAQLGLVFRRKLAEDRERKNADRIRALREIDRAITSTLDLKAVLDLLLEKIDLLLPYSASSVRLWKAETGKLEPVACRNIDLQGWQTAGPRGVGLPRVVFETKQPVVIPNVQTDPRAEAPDFLRSQGLVSYLGIPLTVKDQVLGVMGFYTKEEHDFSSDEIELLTTLARQAAIAIHNSQMYQEMSNLAADLSRSNKVKGEFLSVMSHELRTPLNVVMGYTAMLRDGLLGDINPKQEEALAKIIGRSNDQLAMVNNILFATVLEAQKIKVESQATVLGDLVNQLKSAYETILDKPLQLTWDCSSPLAALNVDAAKIKQILQNLIDNAIKFTQKGSVTVSARIRQQEEEPPTPHASRLSPTWVEFQVRDTGIGIPKDHLPFVFERFCQVDSSETRLYGGVGLGLFIAKKFTELLGGTVEAESEEGKGSTFTVTLPLSPPHNPPQERE